MSKTKTSIVQQRRRGDRKRENRIRNCGVIENTKNHIQEDVNDMAKRMTEMFGNTHLPAVTYKGAFIPKRVLSNFSYLTNG